MKLTKTISLIKNEISLIDDESKLHEEQLYASVTTLSNVKDMLNNILKTLKTELKEEVTK